mmetsp:Transcript_30350/g.61554  ORF Transcript_30350/g.61554 Transcript_30350/m.61554 type:complete len:95 (+) Transcript_30350:64-348(+)
MRSDLTAEPPFGAIGSEQSFKSSASGPGPGLPVLFLRTAMSEAECARECDMPERARQWQNFLMVALIMAEGHLSQLADVFVAHCRSLSRPVASQ